MRRKIAFGLSSHRFTLADGLPPILLTYWHVTVVYDFALRS